MLLRMVLLFGLLLASLPAQAQQLEVSVAAFSPDARGIENVGGSQEPMLALRAEASGGAISLHSLSAEVLSTANLVAVLDSAMPAALWLDDGDGLFSPALDAEIASGVLTGKVLDFAINPAIQVPDGSSVDLWLSVNIVPEAGEIKNVMLWVTVPDADSVGATGGTVTMPGAPLVSNSLTVVQFSVTWIPDCGNQYTTVNIVGTGFTAPVTVTIDGLPCSGTLSVNQDGTQISDVRLPDFRGDNLPIVIETDILGPRLLSQTFSYCFRWGSSNSDKGPACSASSRAASPLGFVVSLLALLLLRASCARRLQVIAA